MIWILTADVGGVLIRASTIPVDVESDDGPLPYLGGLEDLQLREDLPGAGQGADQRTASLDLLPAEDLSSLVGGPGIQSGAGELALLPTAATRWEDRIVVLRGALIRPEYGVAGEPLSLSLAEEAQVDAAPVIAADQTIDDATWPTRGHGVDGRRYPWPWGQPGRISDSVTLPGSPAYPVEITGTRGDSAALVDTLLIAGERVDASTVGLWIEGQSGRWLRMGTYPVTYQADGRGRTCAVVDISGETNAIRQAGGYWIDWAPGAGVLQSLGEGPIRTLPDVLRELVWRSDLPADLGAWAELAAALPWPCSGYLDGDQIAADVVADLLEHTPIALVATPEGVAPRLWRTDGRRSEARTRLTVDEGVTRTSRRRVVRAPSEIVSEVRIAYALDAAADRVTQIRLYRPEWTEAIQGESSSVYVRAGTLRADRARQVRVEVPWADRLSSARLGAWLTRSLCSSPEEVSLEVDAATGLDLPAGELVILVDAEAGLDDLAIVVGRTLSTAPTWTIDLLILDPVTSGSQSSLTSSERPWTPES